MSDETKQITPEDEGHVRPEDLLIAKPTRGRRKIDDKFDLSINSMMDIMTILLVFLLISVTSDPLAIKESSVLKLSHASAEFPALVSIPITVNRKEILVDQKKALSMSCKLEGRPCADADLEKPGTVFEIDPVNKEHGKRESLLVVPLKTALEKTIKQMKDQNVNLPEHMRKKYKETEGVATVICDRAMPYRVIAEVVYTTAMVELHDIRFAVVRTDSR